MKITVTDKAPAQPKIKFPLLMQNINHPDVIVYMTAPNKGVVVAHKVCDFGYNCTTWEHISKWVPFEGKITLSNN